ncbi:hypothetical protein B0H13DRAFT_1055310 [Mycena leptocephala]|nr:hypothetical protein B0H13DRAFT_1055310 [Mycena leptocephala]
MARVVSVTEVFQSFGFSAAEAGRMAAQHRAANGGLEVTGVFPVANFQTEEEDEEEEEEDEQEEDDGDDDDNVDILDLAEEARQTGDLKLCENTLLLCYLKTMQIGEGGIVIKLRCLVRLGELYHQKESWDKAVDHFDKAYKLWDGVQWLADEDRSIHPVAFLRKWAECYERLNKSEQAANTKAKADNFERRFASYWER